MGWWRRNDACHAVRAPVAAGRSANLNKCQKKQHSLSRKRSLRGTITVECCSVLVILSAAKDLLLASCNSHRQA
jgi:hypothetical protein